MKKTTIKDIYVAIRLSNSKQRYEPGTRYITSLDEHWYETDREPLFIFNEKDIPAIKKQLVNCFLYQAAFVYPDGQEVVWDFFHKEHKKVSVKLGGLGKAKLTYTLKK